MARHRLFIYALSGGIFGIADWYYPTLLRVLVPARPPAWLLSLVVEVLLTYGVWLMLALPIAWYETVHTLRPSMAARAVILAWISALVSYYLYYALLLAFIGLPQLEQFLVWSPRDPSFWDVWASMGKDLILGQLLEWSVVALIGGAVVGWCTGWLYCWRRQQASASIPAGPGGPC